MKPQILAIAAVAALLSACSTSTRVPKYACPLDSDGVSNCASMQEAYTASRQAQPSLNPRAQTVFGGRAAQGAGAGAPAVGAQVSGYPEPGEQGMPVFQQPKVMRVWVAPYVDGEGNLRSGEYTYFSTPGSWNYGSLNKAGAASGIMGPNRPDNLGFQPNLAARPAQGNTSRPSAPPSSSSAPPQAQAAAKSAQAQVLPAAPASDSSGTITQPYQRIAN